MRTASRVTGLIIIGFVLCIFFNTVVEAKSLPTYYMLTGEIKKIPVSFHGGNYYYHSENLSVLQFTDEGEMIAKKSGSAVVVLSYFTPENKQIKKKFKVIIHSKVKNLKWKEKTGQLNVGQEFDYKVRYKASSKKNITLKWTSSNPQVAHVDKNGHVKAISKGTTRIKCTVVGQKKTSVSVKLKVSFIPVKKIDVAKRNINIKLESYYNINDTVTVYPGDATNKIIDTLSENENVVKVSYGVLYAAGVGTARVTINSTDGSGCKTTVTVNVVDYVGLNEMRYVAHRGLGSAAPENTVKSFELASGRGFYAVETDLKLSKDDEFVISHDDSLLRMCGLDKNVREMTLEEIRSTPITAGAHYSEYMYDSKATTIPTLSEYLDVCRTYNMVPMIEIKFPEGDDSLDDDNVLYKLVRDVLDVMGSRRVYIISFYDGSIKNLNVIRNELKAKNIKLCLLLGKTESVESVEMYQFCKENDIGFSVDATSSPDVIRRMVNDKISVGVWTVNDPNAVRDYYNMGVEFVVTDTVLWGE